MTFSHCPSCGSSRSLESAAVLDQRKDRQLVHFRCDRCSGSVLSVISVSSVGVSAVGVSTDLNQAEAGRFSGAPPVTTDDVLNAHELFSGGRLDMARLLA